MAAQSDSVQVVFIHLWDIIECKPLCSMDTVVDDDGEAISYRAIFDFDLVTYSESMECAVRSKRVRNILNMQFFCLLC